MEYKILEIQDNRGRNILKFEAKNKLTQGEFLRISKDLIFKMVKENQGHMFLVYDTMNRKKILLSEVSFADIKAEKLIILESVPGDTFNLERLKMLFKNTAFERGLEVC